MKKATNRTALVIVFLTVFIDLVGFGIVLPLLPFYSTELGASPFEVGLIIASYFLGQLLLGNVSAVPRHGGLDTDRIEGIHPARHGSRCD